MALEVGTYISDLVAANPDGASPKSSMDNHLRLIKATIKATFPNISGAVTVTHAELNTVAARGAIAGQAWTGAHDFTSGTIKVPAPVASSDAASKGYADALSMAAALPGQAGNAGKLPVSDGTNIVWSGLLRTGVIRFADSADQTKLVAVNATALAAGATRTLYMPNRDVVLGGFSNLLVIASTATWTPPAGVTRAEITVQDGGASGATASNGPSGGGSGGKSSVSVIAVDPAVAYTCAIGAGAAAGTAGTGVASVAGNASSFFGSGITTLTSTTGQINVPGGAALLMPYGGGTSIGSGGASLFCLPTVGAAPTGYGGGGPGVDTGLAGFNGKSGVIIIRY